MSIVNKTPIPNVNYPVDFSFHSASTLSILQTAIGSFNVPYGLTKLNGSLTTPGSITTAFNIPVVDSSTFVGGQGTNLAGTSFANVHGQYPVPVGTLYIYTSPTNWALIGYTFGPAGQIPIENNTFKYCFVIDGYNGGTGLTFANNTQIYDPRWVTYMLPLSAFTATNVTFDAIDSLHLGLPNSKNANIVSFHWDFGNGTQADGPVVETQYWYTGSLNYPQGSLAAPTEIKVTMTAIDINGNTYYVTHPVIFGQLYTSMGAALTPGYLA